MGTDREPQPTLTGPRVRLRPWRADDVDAVFAACQDAEIQRWTQVPVPYAREHAEGFVGEHRRRRPGRRAAGCSPSSRGTAGRWSAASALFEPRDGYAEAGYWTAPGGRRQGYTAEALGLLCRVGLRRGGPAPGRAGRRPGQRGLARGGRARRLPRRGDRPAAVPAPRAAERRRPVRAAGGGPSARHTGRGTRYRRGHAASRSSDRWRSDGRSRARRVPGAEERLLLAVLDGRRARCRRAPSGWWRASGTASHRPIRRSALHAARRPAAALPSSRVCRANASGRYVVRRGTGYAARGAPGARSTRCGSRTSPTAGARSSPRGDAAEAERLLTAALRPVARRAVRRLAVERMRCCGRVDMSGVLPWARPGRAGEPVRWVHRGRWLRRCVPGDAGTGRSTGRRARDTGRATEVMSTYLRPEHRPSDLAPPRVRAAVSGPTDR